VKFLLDHAVPDDVVHLLLALGHDVHKLRDVLPTTTADEQVLQLASQRNSVLITCNRDDFPA
jgi:predicted nuclease of predicted toxin-antitoxin system